ncbi:hypothetical protein BGX31_006685 [Mortierella sp. GBA43]|nr:hypothetical protein BGX31_006685 [Mortierella sp. GBA43]
MIHLCPPRSTPTVLATVPPASNIPLAHLQSALAHRFLKYAVAEGLIQDQVRGDTCHIKPLIDIDQSSVSELQAHSGPTYNAANPHTNKVQMSMEAAGQTWAAAHDLVWPEGDYYKAQKITIREGVAHLKRGRRYIFVEPVLGPGAPYLYPSRACDTMDEEVQVESATEEHRRPSSDLHRSHDHDHDDASRHEHSALADSEHGTDAAVGGTESEQTHNPDQDKGHEQDQDDDNVDTDNAAQSTTGSSSSSTSTSHAMVSHENADSAVTTAPTSDASTNVSDHTLLSTVGSFD